MKEAALRVKRKTTRKATSIYLDPQAEANIEYINQTTQALLGVKLTPSVIIRRSIELLADHYLHRAVDTLAGKSSPEHKMEQLQKFLVEERQEILRASGRENDIVPTRATLEGKVW